jgi:hypothetical protein
MIFKAKAVLVIMAARIIKIKIRMDIIITTEEMTLLKQKDNNLIKIIQDTIQEVIMIRGISNINQNQTAETITTTAVIIIIKIKETIIIRNILKIINISIQTIMGAQATTVNKTIIRIIEIAMRLHKTSLSTMNTILITIGQRQHNMTTIN